MGPGSQGCRMESNPFHLCQGSPGTLFPTGPGTAGEVFLPSFTPFEVQHPTRNYFKQNVSVFPFWEQRGVWVRAGDLWPGHCTG